MLRKILVYIGFIIACLTVAYAIVTANTYVQLASAIVLYPLLSYAALKLFPRKNKVKIVTEFSDMNSEELKNKIETLAIIEPESTTIETIENTEKREFLRLIGIAGITYFVYSLLNRRGESAFFNRALGQSTIQIEDAQGNTINPAEEHPTDGYQISDLDEYDINHIYYGCIKPDGSWYIMRQDPYSGSFRYIKGEWDYPSSWNNRQKLNYDYFHNVFTK